MRTKRNISMRRIIIACVPPVVLTFVYKMRSVFLVISSSNNYKSKSYYPEAEKKASLKIFWELIVTAWKWGQGRSIEGNYFELGLDCKDRDLRSYVFRAEFGRIKDALNSYSFDYETIFNNKIVTNILFRSWNLPVPKLIGSIEKESGSLYFLSNGHRCPLKDYIKKNDIACFCKPIASLQGRGAFQLEIREGSIFVDAILTSWQDLENRLDPPVTLEEVVCQHESLSALHPHSVNTLRIMTVKADESDAYILSVIQRIGVEVKK